MCKRLFVASLSICLAACGGEQVVVVTKTVVCGNGDLETGEECDDANRDNFDACTNSCEFAACGDGVVRRDRGLEQLGYEECDDGNDDNNDHCRNDCIPARCGDGVVRTDLSQGHPGAEECDDGNDYPDDACTTFCRRARCGDGFIRQDRGLADGGEECDDRNLIQGDACTNECRRAFCGDGFVRQAELTRDDPEWEDCDDRSEDCRNCRYPVCGDGVVDEDLGEECDDGNELHSDECDNWCRLPVDGSSREEAGSSCASIADNFPNLGTGQYWIDPNGGSRSDAFEVFCDMTTNEGGWTLVAVISDDDQNTWTWEQRGAWTVEERPIGRLTAINRDFKSPAYHELAFQDLLVQHEPSGLWASYHQAGNGSQDLSSYLGALRGLQCPEQGSGVPASQGSLMDRNELCDTRLYFNCAASASPVCGGDSEVHSTYGLCFNVRVDGSCDFREAWQGGLGPVSGTNDAQVESRQLGFAEVLNLNIGRPGRGENFVRIFVRD